MSKAIKRNTEARQTFYNNRRSRIPQATRTKIRNIINLYSERKIAQFTTADNLIRKLTTPKTHKENAKAENEYNKMVTPSPHDPPEPSCQLFVYNTMSPNAFSEVHKPSVFARVSPLHIY